MKFSSIYIYIYISDAHEICQIPCAKRFRSEFYRCYSNRLAAHTHLPLPQEGNYQSQASPSPIASTWRPAHTHAHLPTERKGEATMQTSRTRTGVHDHVPYLSRVRSSATQSAFLHHDWQGRTPSRGRPRNKNERGSWLMNHERNGLPPFSLPLRPASSCVFARFAKPERLRTYSALSTEHMHPLLGLAANLLRARARFVCRCRRQGSFEESSCRQT